MPLEKQLNVFGVPVYYGAELTLTQSGHVMAAEVKGGNAPFASCQLLREGASLAIERRELGDV